MQTNIPINSHLEQFSQDFALLIENHSFDIPVHEIVTFSHDCISVVPISNKEPSINNLLAEQMKEFGL